MDKVSGELESDPPYDRLLFRVCVGMGWCGSVINGEPSHVDDYIPETGAVSANQFVDWLFAAEGYDPVIEPAQKVSEHRDSIRRAFVEIMDSEVVDASRLKSDL